jgi:hypothetical protein
MKRLHEIVQKQEAIQARLAEIAGLPEPEGDEAARAQILGDRGTETDDLLAAFDELEVERQPLAARQERLDNVLARAQNPANRESGDGANKWADHRGPEIQRKQDPYEALDVVRSGMVPPADLVARAKTAIEQAPGHMSDVARQQVTGLIEQEGKQGPLIARHMLMTGSPEYHEQFREYVETRYVGQALRAAMSLTNANGGYMVPFTLDPTVILTNSGIADPIRSIANIKQIATDDWNGVTSSGVTAEWLGEGSEAADASPTFGQPTITPKKAAAWVFGSYEMLADSGFASELSRLLADAKVRLEGAAFATGNTGATRPRGIVAAVAAVTASIVTAATTNAFVSGDVYRVADALRPRTRPGVVDRQQADLLADPADGHRRRLGVLGEPRHGRTFPAARPAAVRGVDDVLGRHDRREHPARRQLRPVRDRRPGRHVDHVRADGQVDRQRPADRPGRLVRLLARRGRRDRCRRF